MKRTLIVLFVIIATSCSTRNDVDIKDYPIVTTVKELCEYYDLNLDQSGKYETTSITQYFDGSTEFEYSYDLVESKEFTPLYYAITIDQERTIKDAKVTYTLGKGAVELVDNLFDQGTVEINSLQLNGDESYYAMRTYKGEPNGMFFIVRKGTRIYTMLISGLYTPDHSLVNDLVIPKIAHLEEFKIVE